MLYPPDCFNTLAANAVAPIRCLARPPTAIRVPPSKLSC